MTKQVIANFLKQLRKTSGLSANDVVEKLKNYNIDISAKTLYGYESGLSMLNADAFVSLCRIYKCDNPMDMFGIPSIKPEEIKHIEKYRSLDPHGQQTVDLILDWEAERVKQLLDTQGQLRQSQSQVDSLKLQLSHERTVSRFFAYYGRVAAAGTSVEFSDIAAGVRAYPENEINKQADYVIGVNGDSMEPEYFDGDVVYVQKTDHIEIGDIGIFQRGNSIYIKKVGENGLISLNPDYPPLMADGDRIMVLGKVLGKAEEI